MSGKTSGRCVPKGEQIDEESARQETHVFGEEAEEELNEEVGGRVRVYSCAGVTPAAIVAEPGRCLDGDVVDRLPGRRRRVGKDGAKDIQRVSVGSSSSIVISWISFLVPVKFVWTSKRSRSRRRRGAAGFRGPRGYWSSWR